MSKIRKIELTKEEKLVLEKGYTQSPSHAFRKRCLIVLLKSENRTSKDVGEIVKMNQVSINSWLDRYEANGIEGLKTQPGRGRKPIFDKEKDSDQVREVVCNERQRLKAAKEILSQEMQRTFCEKTLVRFLKKLAASSNE